jgi:hypothetical protein
MNSLDWGVYPDAMGPAKYYFIELRIFWWVIELRAYRQ